ncbi:MAG: MurR/RpiR family transcriptional regulator [Betaproteobacteria bacterium]
MTRAKARTFDALKAEISRVFPELARQLQTIARYALDNPDDLALNTVAVIARDAGVQPSSMIRFANALGFGGFTEMQLVFRNHLVSRSGSYRERIARIRRSGDGTSPPAVLHQFVNDSIAGLEHLEANIPAATHAAAMRLLARAERIHVLAQRRSFPVAYYLAYALNQLELRAHLIDSVGGLTRDFSRNIGRKEALLTISFRNYSPDVVAVAADCHKRGVPVVVITDTPLSPLRPHASACFELGDDGGKPFRSLVEPMCLAQALVVSLGHQLAERPAAAGRQRASASRAPRARRA